jgi:hypothetical protein
LDSETPGLDTPVGMISDDRQGGLFRRVGELARPAIELEADGIAITALKGDTLLVALLTHGARLRESEFGDGACAGFCLMGACQECWVWTEAGERLRACSTAAEPGMKIVTRGAVWPTPR